MKRIWKKGASLFCALLCALLCAAAVSVPAAAYTAIDTGRKTSLTISYGKEEKQIPDAGFELFRVADVSEQVYYTLSGDFKDYRVELNGLDSEGWLAAAETLAVYAKRDERIPVRSGKTDAKGQLSFHDLDVGLYLAVGESTKIGRDTYTPESMLILLPDTDEEDQWIYDLTVFPKYEEVHKPGDGGGDGDHGGGDTVNRKVLKVWNDGEGTKRPGEIVVQLLRNGRVYDTVTLNSANQWRYTWYGLDAGADWQVAEYEVPEHYTVSVSRSGITFVITNTYGTETPPMWLAGDSSVAAGMGVKLPQTGVLWWPVPMLACAGLLLFLSGWIYYRQRDSHDEE